MKTWLLNPRSVAKLRRTGGTTTVIEIDCPCGCGIPFTLPPIVGFTPPEPGAQLTQQEWRQVLNDYTLEPIHRVLNGVDKQCGWDGRIRNGRIRYRELDTEDDTPFGTRVQETLARIEAREEKVRGRLNPK